MGWIFLLIALICFIVFVRKSIAFKFRLAPETLEIRPIKGLKKMTDILEQSLSNRFMGNVEIRVNEKNRLKENEYDWRLLDLKRYFIMTAFLKESPMFSEKVDELWHEMLMFTREYEDASKNYLGKKLHHSPNVNGKPDPDLRGFFDWVYAELFFIRDENIFLYKGFFRHPVHPNVIEEFTTLTEDELIDLYFKHDTTYMAAVRALIAAMKISAAKVKNYEKKTIREMMKRSKTKQNYNAMLVPFLSVSYFHYDEFTNYMKISSDKASSCTSCGSGGFYTSDSNGSSDSSCSSGGGGGD